MYHRMFHLEGCTVEADPKRHVLRVTLKGMIASETYRQINRDIAAYARHQPVTAIVSNLRDSGLVSPEDQAYVAEHILPNLIASGLRYIAFVLPANLYAELALKNFSQHLEQAGPVYQRYFTTVAEAEAWLTGVLVSA